jgi:cellulose synthase/poly-beta-1,6-N-acetylglucosamine synthase-like glycosyltransferase
LSAIELVFWSSLLLLVYVYAGYPALLHIISELAPKPTEKRDILPTVSVLIAAYNEVDHISNTVLNKLEQDYPADRLDVIVVSDGSRDGTDELVQRLMVEYPGRLRLLQQTPRMGKTAALNTAVQVATGDILVFSDANSLYGRDALRRIVANFADLRVGYVTGQMVYTNPDGSLTGDGCSAYMRYENALRRNESLIGSIVGVDGGIDAVRRELYVPMRPDQLPDFVLPLAVVAAGYRVVYEPQALLEERVLSTRRDEYSMRVRVALRALWALKDMRKLLHPFNHGLFGWQLLSHKVLRYLAFVPLSLLVITNALLLQANQLYPWTFAGQLLFYAAAAGGYMAEGRAAPPIFTLPYYFTLINLASAQAFLRFLAGQKQVMWRPRTGDA